MSNRRRPLLVPRPGLALPVSRRTFLRGTSVGALSLAGGGLLAACGTEGASQTTESCVSEDLSESEKVVNWSNWPAYIDPISQDDATLGAFEDMTGITVEYTDDVNDNLQFYARVRDQLGSCEETGRDMFTLTDWMAARMIGLGWVQKLDGDNLPQVQANLLENLRSPSWDPDREYSVPWQSGLTGIAYNEDLTGEVGSFEDLVTRSDLKGKITLLTEMQDTMIFMLLLEGSDPEDFTDDEFYAALDRLEEIKDSGQVRQFTGNEYRQDLAQGNIHACEAWSGDVIQLQFDNPAIKFVSPEEGLSLWSDNSLVPNKATHKTNAEMLMDYYYDPTVAAELAAWVNYICPVQGAQEEMEKIAPGLVDNVLIFPDDELLANTHDFMALDPDKETEYQTEFTRVIGG
ncbi:MAG: spermidine/putrescine ABC transporter substrate-binding protein [Actinomycetota bacterium]|nr:spermidine/putrescine ABC transporter substrate-binding protein [Actinomycetota bacterium]MDQ3663402.1 spermidine/putrescine ABC transporter substrate-binding protein [Actinomycetota bacterium]